MKVHTELEPVSVSSSILINLLKIKTIMSSSLELKAEPLTDFAQNRDTWLVVYEKSFLN